MSGGRIALLVVGALLALLGFGMAVGGGALWLVHGTQRDADGYFTSSTQRYVSTGYAITSQELDLGGGGDAAWAADLGDLARVRVTGQGAAPAGRPLFIGIGPRAAVEAYLAGVPRSEVDDVDFDPFRARYLDVPGTRAPGPPAAQGFWVARAAGPGAQTLEWDVRGGTWMLVVMNATPVRGVAADLGFGVKVDVLLPIAIGLLVVGLVLLGAGVTMVVFGARGGSGAPPDLEPAGTL
jgi:hypothetical protein